MSKPSTVVGIQYFRGIAALLVVIDHAAAMMAFPEYFGRTPGGFLFYGAVGVPIFFVISGFIIVVVSLDAHLRPRLSLGEFYRRRFVRIIPFMWTCVIGYNLLRFIGTGTFDWAPFLRAMFLWPLGDLRPNVIWTLRHEAVFYILFGLTMLGFTRRLPVLVLWFVSPILLWVLQTATPGIYASLPADLQELIAFLANVVNLAFGAGFVLGTLYLRNYPTMQPRLGGGFLLAALLAASEFAALALIAPIWDNLWVYLNVALASAVLVWLGISLRPGTHLISRFGQFLGDASYSIYLVHNAVLLILLTLSAKIHLVVNIWLIYSCLTVFAIAGGCVVHLLLERPVSRYAKRLFRPRYDVRPREAISRT